MLRELIKAQHQKNSLMSKVKFINNCQVEGALGTPYTFVRNGIWDYLDKYITLIDGEYDNEPLFGYVYRIETDYGILIVVENYVVEIDYVINKDYTLEGWNDFIMTDAIVEDGNYVKVWEDINKINKPVKEVADQCDYNFTWRALQVKIDKMYGNGGFETA